MATGIAVLFLLTLTSISAVSVLKGHFSREADGSLSFSLPDVAGTSMVGLHYSINKPLHGVAAGDYNIDISSKSGGTWEHHNTKVQVKDGDIIYYWLLMIINNEGKQELNLQQRIQSSTTSLPTTKTTTTSTPKTTAPGTTKTTAAGTNKTTVTPINGTTTEAPSKPTQKPLPNPNNETCATYPCVIFEDNFDYLDLDKWEHEITASGGGNWEFEVYVNNRSNSFTRDGKLYIKPTLTADTYSESFLSSGNLDLWGSGPASQCTAGIFWGCFRTGTPTNYLNPITSARLRSVRSFNFRYGKVEFDAKMPQGDWLWPALWLLPKHEHYGGWPASGEIDIVESRGNKNLKDDKGVSVGVDQVASTMHWGPHYGLNGYEKSHKAVNAKSGDFGSSFHKFAVQWEPDSMTFFVDDEQILHVNPGEGGFWKYGEFDKLAPGTFNPWKNDGGSFAPFDREFFLIMNVAVGGTNGFFGDNWTNQGGAKPWNNLSPTAPRDFWNARSQWLPTWKLDSGDDAAMQVNYVKVTKLRPDP